MRSEARMDSKPRERLLLLLLRHDQRRSRHGARDIGVAVDRREVGFF
jgi:hypothetical protein